MSATYILKPAQELAALRIASGWTQKEAAKEAGVSEQTFSAAWMKNPAFVAAVNREKLAMLDATRDHLRTLGTKATAALEDVLDNAHRPADRLKAAEMVLPFWASTTYRTGFIDGESGKLHPRRS